MKQREMIEPVYWTRIFLTALLLTLLAGGGILYIRFIGDTRLIRSEIEKDETAELSNLAARMEISIEHLLTDLYLIENHPYVRAFLKERTDSAEERAVSELVHLKSVRDLYDEIRITDQRGAALTTIDRSGVYQSLNDVDSSLQNSETKPRTLEPGHTALSAITLAATGEKIDLPFTPILTAAVGVYQGEALAGKVEIEYRASDLLNQVTETFKPGSVYLADRDGFFLLHPDPNREWGMMFDGRRNHRLSEDLSFLSRDLEKGKTYHTRHDGAIYSFRRIEFSDSSRFNLTGNFDFLEIIHRVGKPEIDAIIGARARSYWLTFLLGFLPVSIVTAIFIAFILSTRRYYRRQMEYYAATDSLTGCLNRRTGLDILSHHAMIGLKKQESYTIASIDINSLKSVNDQYGHATGDEMIKGVIDHLRRNIRSSDTICRMGSDEFLIIFPSCSADQARAKVSKTREELKWVNTPYEISISAGYAEVDSDTDPRKALKYLTQAEQDRLRDKEEQAKRRPKEPQ